MLAVIRCLPDRLAVRLLEAARLEGWQDRRLSARLLVAAAVAARGGQLVEPARDRDGRASARRLHRLGMSARTWARAIDDLVRLGLVTVERRSMGPTGWAVTPVVRLAADVCWRSRRDHARARLDEARQHDRQTAPMTRRGSAMDAQDSIRGEIWHTMDRDPVARDLVNDPRAGRSSIRRARASKIDGRGPPIGDEDPDARQCWRGDGRDRWLTSATCERPGCCHAVPRRPPDAPAGRNRYCRCCWEELGRRRPDDGLIRTRQTARGRVVVDNTRSWVRAATDQLDAAEAAVERWERWEAETLPGIMAAHRADARRALATCLELEPVVCAPWAAPALDREAAQNAMDQLHRAEWWIDYARDWLDMMRDRRRRARRRRELCRAELAAALDEAGPPPDPVPPTLLALLRTSAPAGLLDGWTADEIAAARAVVDPETARTETLARLQSLLDGIDTSTTGPLPDGPSPMADVLASTGRRLREGINR